ncbi:MAG: sigma 54-interacting transcriptional regulator [Candidatus Handelsmanbacteria bacterium]|nr:sigma 54-interacting transcriptional regulator [Candidatus Handelsmanbacteria bacterium]
MNVLILRESGTGKEVMARALHEANPRRRQGIRAPVCRLRATPSSSTRRGSCPWPCSPSCCGSCRSGQCAAWARPARWRWTCGWWRPPAGPWARAGGFPRQPLLPAGRVRPAPPPAVPAAPGPDPPGPPDPGRVLPAGCPRRRRPGWRPGTGPRTMCPSYRWPLSGLCYCARGGASSRNT